MNTRILKAKNYVLIWMYREHQLRQENKTMIHKSFRSITASALLALPLVALSIQSVLAQNLEFPLHNQTSQTLKEFYVETSEEVGWGYNLLQGQEVIEAGESGTVTIADGKTTCVYDIRAIWADGSKTEEFQLNLCELGSYTYYTDETE